MIIIFFRSIKRAELAIDIADVGVVDIAIDDVGDDFAPAAIVAFLLRKIAPRICERAEFLQRPAIKLQRVFARNSFARKELFRSMHLDLSTPLTVEL